MHLRRVANGPGRRRGIVLLIVLAMLTLFAIAGLTFVLYADAASESARINRDAESFTAVGGPDMDPNQAFALFLGQFIYGTTNDTNGASSSLRGHSLAETMYGSFDANGTVPSDTPFNGTGRLHTPQGAPSVNGQDEFNLINYMWFKGDQFVHDPARYGYRADPTQAFQVGDAYTGGQNPPYTYPDLNNMFLASIRSDGTVVQPSYHRDWTGFGPLSPSNGNWSGGNAAVKYMVLRPRPADMGPGFPAPTSNANIPGSVIPAADVKNLTGTPGGNDSIWIDIGAPVLTTAAGVRYKMLVAPLVLDLDSRVNLNVVGNVLANGSAQASNQGWGPWEVSMAPVLSAGGNEWQNLLVGGNGVIGRYGKDGLPSSKFSASGPTPHVYAPGDLDGLINLPAPGGSVTGTNTGPYTLPAANAGYFPTWDTNAYLNGQLQEHTNAAGVADHPMYYNYFFPKLLKASDDQLLPLPDHASLMWAGVNASSLSSSLVKLCPKTFTANNPAAVNQTTLLSMDLDRPGASPYIYDPSNAAYTVAYHMAGPGQVMWDANGVTAFNFPKPNPRPPAPAQQGEFDIGLNNTGTWRSVLANTLSRMNLNRPLTAYTGPNGDPKIAASDRTAFAQDIFTRLLAVTGMTTAYNGGNLTNADATQYATMRWLAQIAANVVDYIDTDDVMTAFRWASKPLGSDSGYVFGTELPKLVVNEVYLEYDNNAADPGMIPNPSMPTMMMKAATKPYNVNVWTELLNPLPTTADPNAPPGGIQVNNDAKLVDSKGNALYQLVITSPNKGLRNAANLVGDPDAPNPPPPSTPFAPQPYSVSGTPPGTYSSTAMGGQVLAVVNNWGSVQNVTPVGTATSSNAAANSNTGFLVVGPQNPPPIENKTGQQTQIQTSITASNMTYSVDNANAQADNPTPPTILLQRLANPNALFDATTNPYVTVDYVEMDQVQANAPGNVRVINDARPYTAKGLNGNFISEPNKRYSYGRNQPYAALGAAGKWQQQQFAPANPAQTNNQPTTSFFNVNVGATAAVAPDWLVHLDRALISPVELLNVSTFKPHELTQQFYKDPTTGAFQHNWAWMQQNFLLYRLFEFVKVKNMMPGVAEGGRVPGKININTIDATTGQAVFQALADAQPGNSFTTTDVQSAFQTLMAIRTPSGQFGPNNQPFWGMAAGAATPPQPNGDAMGATQRGIVQTFLNGTLANTDAKATHPYQQMELLNKIYGNLTTRSNVFAVWLTVGFFQVTNDQTQPVQLGAEINLAQGKNIRHHMFAIVDRTQIQTFTTTTANAISAGAGQSISLTTTTPTDPRTGIVWQIQAASAPGANPAVPGSVLVYDPGVYNVDLNGFQDPTQPNEETVVVQAGTPMTANFTFPHKQGATVISRGNPGPWKLPTGPYPYDPTQDSQVVPYLVIID